MYIPQEADEDEYETSEDEEPEREPERDHRYRNADNYEQEYYGTSESE